MKVALILLISLAVVYGEHCNGTDTTQCAHEVCINDLVPTCLTGICTCGPRPTQTGCQSLADCNSYWAGHHCNQNHRVCQNGECVCQHGSHG